MVKCNNIKMQDISVVVQGAIDPINTLKCLKSIRKHLPDAEIILSTWKGSNVSNLDFDHLILNDDPGAFDMSPWEKNNVKRQIYSTLQGIKKSKRKYVLKIRSDMELLSAKFLNYFDKFNNYNDEWHFLDKRIIIPSMVSRDPRVWESPMCPSDWCSFGLKTDMLKLWDIKFPTKKDEEWFKLNLRPESVRKIYPALEARYNPEQFIWIGFVSKYKKNLHTHHMFDVNEKSIEETLFSFANNLIIISEKQFGIKFLKPYRKGSDRWHIITYNDFLRIYNRYANGKKFIFPIDWQRILLLKYCKKSIERLFQRAKNERKVADFLETELAYYFPLLYFIFKPFIALLHMYEKKRPAELWWKVDDTKKPYFSLMIPTHGNLKYLKQVFDCLKIQTYKDFEVVISDDSPSLKIRQKIKEMLVDFHQATGQDIKYIFSHENLGQSKNTNQGLNHIRGKWVRILHSDDLISPILLQLEYNLIQENPFTIALFHNTVNFHNNIDYTVSNDNFIWQAHSADFIILNALHSHCPVPSSLLFQATLINEIGKFDPYYCRACDWEFWSRIVLFALVRNKQLVHIQDENVFYRLHENSNSNKKKTKLKNYKEYEKMSYSFVRKLFALPKLPLTQFEIDYFLSKSFVYRKLRLLKDYKELPFLWKIRYFFKFKKLLEKRG